ncbi:MAG: hypothetical protein JWO89_1762 [Verrucomicrobiaceae bacterium]|nr:hypothetical protein [Verrucomicrobiaceae bacterium]
MSANITLRSVLEFFYLIACCCIFTQHFVKCYCAIESYAGARTDGRNGVKCFTLMSPSFT